MKMKTYYILIGLLLLIPLVTAETTTITFETDVQNGSVVIKMLNNTFSYSTAIATHKQDVTLTHDIEKQSINYTLLESVVDSIVSEGNLAEQSWISQTFMPSVEEMDKIKDENEITTAQLEICQSNRDNLVFTIGQINTTTNLYMETLEKENSTYSMSLAGIMIIIFLFLAFLIYERFKTTGVRI